MNARALAPAILALCLAACSSTPQGDRGDDIPVDPAETGSGVVHRSGETANLPNGLEVKATFSGDSQVQTSTDLDGNAIMSPCSMVDWSIHNPGAGEVLAADLTGGPSAATPSFRTGYLSGATLDVAQSEPVRDGRWPNRISAGGTADFSECIINVSADQAAVLYMDNGPGSGGEVLIGRWMK